MFEWNDGKSRCNLTKHGLSFEDAEKVFDGPCLTFEDTRSNYGEERFLTLGRLHRRVVVIAHTYRGEAVRIISMRKASSRERKLFEERQS